VKIALTIAGSDSIGGAGIQADLKAFASLGVHGCSAITCITAQNTTEITKVDAVPPEMLRAQIEAILEDMSPGAAKTGAVYSAENVGVISELFSDRRIPLVIDPVLVATTGAKLAKTDLLSALKKKLVPICALITPNISETEALTSIRISGLEQAAKAAELLQSIGASGVLIKGIVENDRVTDYLAMSDGSTNVLTSSRIPGEFHGTGCVLSALIAGNIALGEDICTAVVKSRGAVFDAIERGRALGKGIKIIDPLEEALIGASKVAILDTLENLRTRLESEIKIQLVPEVGSNLGYSIPNPRNESDVAGFTGRIVREGKRPRIVGCPRFGASKHVARIIVAASRQDPRIRSAMNIKFNDVNLDACKKAGLTISSFSRENEPDGVSSMDWGTTEAIKALGRVPDAIWDAGGHGKEPMIRIIGNDPVEVLDKIHRITKVL
jgi:hydroxymethylpyrimidine kinase / phosphomethylpyrimidine kinase / thiamine-phosphate diphosphorylase